MNARLEVIENPWHIKPRELFALMAECDDQAHPASVLNGDIEACHALIDKCATALCKAGETIKALQGSVAAGSPTPTNPKEGTDT